MITHLHEESATYTLVIGAEDNTLVGLLPNYDPTPVADPYLVSKKMSDGVLSPTVSRSYWISWVGRKIEFGRGGMVGLESYFSYSEDGVSPVTMMAGYYVGKEARATMRFIETRG